MSDSEIELWLRLFKLEIEDFIKKIIKDEDDPNNKNKLLELIPNYNISIKNSSNQLNSDNICLARTFKNGEEGRCSKTKIKGCELCKRHEGKLIYGKITEPIPNEKESKFTKRMTINYSRDTSDCIEYPIIIDKTNLFVCNKNKLTEISITNNIYLYDKSTKIIYSNGNRPTYIGRVDNNLIIR